MKKMLGYMYLAIVCLFVFFSYLFIDPNFFYLKYLYTGVHLDQRLLVSFIYSFFIIAFFVFYAYFLKKKGNAVPIKRLIIFSMPLLFAYPAVLSFDIFNYILTARLTFFYFENPYIVMPIEIINEPMLRFTHAANKLALYGPLWIILTSVPYYAGFGIFMLIVFLFKLFVSIFYFFSLRIIYLLSNSHKSILFFALNPIVLIETFVSGHNDIVMMALALTSFHFLTKKRILIAVILIILSILIKYATVFLLPLFVFVAYKETRGDKVNMEKIGKWGFYSMLIIFFLSSFREEIYPWYAIWFLPFAALTLKNRFIFYLSLFLSFTLMFRYVPYMLLGTHLGPTPIIKTMLLILPIIGTSVVLLFWKRK